MKLLFKNPVFYLGKVNTTVRLGDKWLNAVKVGDELEVYETGRETVVIGRAVVENVSYFDHFGGVPINVLRLEHDPECHSYEGLVKAMVRAYGPEFNENNPVTVVFFSMYA